VLRAFGLTDKGRIRPTNEDCFAIEEELGLCVIADGMGGHNAGEVAARLAVDAIVDIVGARFRSPESDASFGAASRGSDVDAAAWPFGYDPTLSADGNLLRTAVHLANVQILETAMTDHRYAGMGTTIVAARVTGGVLSVAHVGDSRLYVFAAQRLRAMTLDDSWMATVLAQDPKVDPLLLQYHPMRNALTNVVGARPRTDVHVVETPLAGGELLLLTTDGVHGVLDEPRIVELLQADEEPRAIANSLIASALIRGSRDNCTAIVARYIS
jgi:serine/threonine protein phosphatase PrpC